MVKSTFFTGQPVFAQLCKYLDREEVLKISTESGGERYRKYLTRGRICEWARTKSEHAGGCQRKKERLDLWKQQFHAEARELGRL